MLLQDAIVEQAQQPAIVQRTNQSAKSLLQRQGGAGYLVLEEGIAALFIDGFDPRSHDGIVGDRERQPIDDDATELLALHVNPLPK